MKPGKLPFLLILLALAGASCRSDSQEGEVSESPATQPQAQSTPLSAEQQAAYDTAEPHSNRKEGSADFGLPLGSLPPDVRRSLDKISVLGLRDPEMDQVWTLEDRGSDYDLIVLNCSPEALSTARVEAIIDWAKKGHGLFIQGRHSGVFGMRLLPPGHFLEHASEWSNDPTLVEEGELVRHVSIVNNYFWCPLRFSPFRVRRHPPNRLEDDVIRDPAALFSQHGERFLPVLVGSRLPQETAFLFASTHQGARVVWFSGDIDFSNKKCPPQYDDVRLWSNLMHWLAGASSKDSGSGG